MRIVETHVHCLDCSNRKAVTRDPGFILQMPCEDMSSPGSSYCVSRIPRAPFFLSCQPSTREPSWKPSLWLDDVLGCMDQFKAMKAWRVQCPRVEEQGEVSKMSKCQDAY